MLHDLVAEHVDLHVPAEVVDALRQRLEHVDRRRAGLHQVEADAAHAEIVQALELGVGHARVDDGDAARRRPDLRDAVERAGIVGAVGRGLHDDVARRADALLQKPIVVDLGVGRLQGRARRDREAAVVDVHVAVAGVLRRLQLRRLGAGRPRHLVLGLRPRRRRGEDARAKRRRSQALQDPTAFQQFAHDCLPRRRPATLLAGDAGTEPSTDGRAGRGRPSPFPPHSPSTTPPERPGSTRPRGHDA